MIIKKFNFKKNKTNFYKQRLKKKKRYRNNNKKIIGTITRPRLFVYRTNKYLDLEIIIDKKKKFLYFNSTRYFTKKKNTNKNDIINMVKKVKDDFKKIKKKNTNIQKCIFDRNMFLYVGKIKFLAQLLRKEEIII